MKFVAPDGRTFERTNETFVFTKDPLVVLQGLTEYWIDDEPVKEEKFREEIEAALKTDEKVE